MLYIKNNVITASPVVPNVVNPSHDTIIKAGWEEYIEPPRPIPEIMWHDSTRHHRFFLSFEQAADMAEMFPEFALDLSAARLPVYKGELNGQQGKYYYFNELFPHHKTAIVEAGGVIEDKN
ncbi:MAG: hypothetical protein JW783_00410 [Bacteroidales bacterium]|nr:hypothetical protein [Bacteroidales bacterium]MBN2748483.1 hypothetical protein [Bacteroidales bacterium]